MPRLFLSLLALLFGLVSYAQSDDFFSTATSGLFKFESAELLGAAATNLCAPSNVGVVRTSGTILTIATGASATVPKYIRFGTKARALTVVPTLTISSGTSTGLVTIYSHLNTQTGTMTMKAYNPTGNTLSGSNITVVTSSTTYTSDLQSAVKIYEWTITTGSYNTTGVNKSPATDCWVDFLSTANYSSGDVTVTVTNGQGDYLFPVITIPMNTVYTFALGGGKFFDGGLVVTSDTASAIDIMVRGGRK